MPPYSTYRYCSLLQSAADPEDPDRYDDTATVVSSTYLVNTLSIVRHVYVLT